MRPLGWYIGWLGHDNLGDEAMWDLCRARFPHVEWQPYDPGLDAGPRAATAQVARPRRAIGPLVRAVAQDVGAGAPRIRGVLARLGSRARARAAGEVAILGGGTIINRNYIEHYRALRARTGRPVPVFASGVGNVPFWTQKEATWVDRRAEWVEAFAELPVVGVRGPLSHALLTEAGATNVEIVGDPALLLRPSRAPRPATGGAMRVGLNVGLTLGGKSTMWGSPDDTVHAMTELARRLLQAGREVELFAVWPKDLAACEAVARMLGDPRLRVAPALVSADAFLNYVQDSYDAVVAFKLHAGVLAAAANVPFVMLEYRPKCRDFTMSIGWEALTIRTDALDVDWMEARVEELLSDLPGSRRRLGTAVDEMRGRLDAYLTRIEPLLR